MFKVVIFDIEEYMHKLNFVGCYQNGNKLAPYGTDGRLFATYGSCQIQSHVMQKIGQISEIRHNQI